MNGLIALFVAPAAAAMLSLLASPLISRLAVRVGAVDMPGDRKIHSMPTPRLGGLAVITSIVVVWATATLLAGWSLLPDLRWGLGLGAIPVVLVSIVDDVRGVSVRYKLLAHAIGSAVAVAFGVQLEPEVHLLGMGLPIGVLAIPMSMLWLVGVTNAFNIIDGLDGLSAGLALISSASMSVVFILVGQRDMAIAALVVAGALAGFLPFNVHPARLFLGDTGATAIGFCLAAFALKGGSTLSSGFAAIVPFLILGLPIVDTFITMVRRTIKRLESHRGGMFVADRDHIHHRLLALGIDHARAVLILYGAGVAFAAIAFISMFLDVTRAALFLAAAVIAGFVGVNRLGYDEFAFIRRGTMLRVYEIPVFKKALFVVFVDLALVVIAAYIAVALQLNSWGSGVLPLAVDLATTLAPLTAIVFWKTGMYRGSWRVATVADLARAAIATTVVTTTGMMVHALLWRASHSSSLFVMYGLTSLVLVTASRASYVLLQNSYVRGRTEGQRVLVYGAGRGGVAAVQELFANPNAMLRPVGFIDDDPSKRERIVNGLAVLGSFADIPRVIASHDVVALVVATTLTPEHLDAARAACVRAGIGLFRRQLLMETMIALPKGESLQVADRALAPQIADSQEQRDSASISWGAGPCPKCKGSAVRRSRARNFLEELLKKRTQKRLYRCAKCGWRGWLLPLETAVSLEDTTAPAIDGLETVLAGASNIRREL